MKGAEEVYGVDTEQDTDYIDVPGSEKGYFVDNAFVDAPYVSEVPEAKGNSYFMETSGGGTWCWYFGTGQELKACRSDFAWQATQLEAGGEIAAEGKPTFDSSSNNAAEWTNYTWHTWISGAAVVATPGLCWSPLNGAPDNMYYDTCSGDEET